MNDHPWGNFLDARWNCIKYFRQQGKSDTQIVDELSLTEQQLKSITEGMEQCSATKQTTE